MNRLREIRMKQNLRQIDLAQKADVSLTWIWVLENGFQQRVSQEIQSRVARDLGCSVEEIFGSHEKAPR